MSCILALLDQIDSACSFVFFFNDTATTEIYTLSLHDALPIYDPWNLTRGSSSSSSIVCSGASVAAYHSIVRSSPGRSEEHTSELQSQSNLVCRLLLEKKKKTPHSYIHEATYAS